MSRGPDVTTQLERALLTSARAAGCPLDLITSEMTRWASATFAGTRHELKLTAGALPAFDDWLEALPEADLALRDHLVADLVIQWRRREGRASTVALEVLTIEA